MLSLSGGATVTTLRAKRDPRRGSGPRLPSLCCQIYRGKDRSYCSSRAEKTREIKEVDRALYLLRTDGRPQLGWCSNAPKLPLGATARRVHSGGPPARRCDQP